MKIDHTYIFNKKQFIYIFGEGVEHFNLQIKGWFLGTFLAHWDCPETLQGQLWFFQFNFMFFTASGFRNVFRFSLFGVVWLHVGDFFGDFCHCDLTNLSCRGMIINCSLWPGNRTIVHFVHNRLLTFWQFLCVTQINTSYLDFPPFLIVLFKFLLVIWNLIFPEFLFIGFESLLLRIGLLQQC